MDLGFEKSEEWKKQRNEAFLKQDYSGEPVIQEDIDRAVRRDVGLHIGSFCCRSEKGR